MAEKRHDLATCSLNFAFTAISGKWKPFIIWYLHDAPDNTCRYGELKRRVPWDISHKIFTKQLQELERDGIITRMEYDEKPLRVEYSLSERGKLLAPVILYMRDWGAMASDRFTDTDLLDRTHGVKDHDILRYGYQSEELEKSVEIVFKY